MLESDSATANLDREEHLKPIQSDGTPGEYELWHKK